jgi:hypothetical protein
MATAPTAAAPKRKSVRKPAGPKPVYLIYSGTGVTVHALSTNAEEAMLALAQNPGAEVHRAELPAGRRAAPAPEAAS